MYAFMYKCVLQGVHHDVVLCELHAQGVPFPLDMLRRIQSTKVHAHGRALTDTHTGTVEFASASVKLDHESVDLIVLMAVCVYVCVYVSMSAGTYVCM